MSAFEHAPDPDGSDAADGRPEDGAVVAHVPFMDVARLSVHLLGIALHGQRAADADAGDTSPGASERLVVDDSTLAPLVSASFTAATAVAGAWPGHRQFQVPDEVAAGLPATLATLGRLEGARPMPALFAALSVATGELLLAGQVLPRAEQPWYVEHLGSPTRLAAACREHGAGAIRPDAIERLADVGSRLEEHHPDSLELAFVDLAAAAGFAARTVLPAVADREQLGRWVRIARDHARRPGTPGGADSRALLVTLARVLDDGATAPANDDGRDADER